MDGTGAIVGGTIAEKTALCVKNVKAVLAEAGSSIDKVVKTTVFLSDMSYFAVRSGVSCYRSPCQRAGV